MLHYDYAYLMEITQIISQNVKQARAKAGISQKVMSDRCGVSVQQISDVESGRKKPSLELLFAMAVALGVNSSDLLNINEKPQPLKQEPSKVLAMYASVPDRVVELAHELGLNHEAWEGVLGVLRFASDQERQKQAAKIG